MKNRYVAFLRGINVSGHHKVPMAQLREEMTAVGFENVVTILNTGNIIFDAASGDTKKLEKIISERLEKTFGFSVPTIIRSIEIIHRLLNSDPFKDIALTKDIRLYISLLKDPSECDLVLPWTNENGSYKILAIIDDTIFSVLDLSTGKTTKGMASLEKFYGKNITTRNWNTIKRIEKKLGE